MNSSELIFIERPQRIFQDCMLLVQNYTYIQELKCLSSKTIGTIVGYLIPIFSIPCIMINLFIAINVMMKGKKASRQLIYIAGPVQTMILIVIDITFAFKFRQQLKKHRTDGIDVTSSKQMHRYLLLFISAVSYNILAATQCIFLLLARLGTVSFIKFESGLAYNISDILWYLNSLREVLDFVIYHRCFHVFSGITSRISKMFSYKSKETISISRDISKISIASAYNY
ncbi:unnamed protein product [Schistosoma haematobium]|nr:unnamed protein product [Schistosoma haematobium]